MYKRKFNPPALQKPTAPVAPSAAAAVVPNGTNDPATKAKQQLANYIFGSNVDSEKENNANQHAAFKPVLKKQKLFAAPTAAKPQPLRHVQEKQDAAVAVGPQAVVGGSAAARAFSVLYTKREKWKKKSDKGFQDGVIELRADSSCTLLDTEGKTITKGKPKIPKELESGATFDLGNFVCEFDQDINYESYKRGTCFTDACHAPSEPNLAWSVALPAKSTAGSNLLQQSRAAGLGGRRPVGSAGGTAGLAASGAGTSIFDATAPGALLLNGMQWQDGQGKLASGRAVSPVVVDPYIARHLRPHQREGVKFLYECVMGLRSPQRSGCLLADEMGLGKTLQVIALLWTLLRQGPEGAPVARKAIVVAPATLVANWGKEVKKWLGQERMGFIQLSTGSEAATKVNDFKLGSVWKLLIGSYETLRKHADQLVGCCDVLVCDEGHRLKASGGNKTINSLLQLACQRRIVLTGTPLQNNLQVRILEASGQPHYNWPKDIKELHALLSFAAGDVLGNASQFKRIYGDPITRSRDKDASAKEQDLGAARAEELQRQTTAFVLRRTQEVLSKHLPPLAVHTIFCRPSQLQLDLYSKFLRSKRMNALLYGHGGDSEGVLPAITILRKMCNHPRLLLPDDSKDNASSRTELQQQGQGQVKLADLAVQLLQQQLEGCSTSFDTVEVSGKLLVLSHLLHGAVSGGSKVVVVSTSTTALDLIDNLLCKPNGWQSVRIDGGTSVDERQTIVDNFNTRGVGQVFLLSTRAGGAGLNLIGANHLVLYDSDWNPAMDKQAMARIWRDGQAKPCFVHRLLTTGTIEEKVYQRQIMKADLAGATMEAGGKAASMSHNELKQLFGLELGTECSTKQLLDSCSAGESVVWLSLPTDSSSSELPSVLATAVAAGSITAINREKLPGEVAKEAPGVPSTAIRTDAAMQATQMQHVAGSIDDVDELEVDDD